MRWRRIGLSMGMTMAGLWVGECWPRLWCGRWSLKWRLGCLHGCAQDADGFAGSMQLCYRGRVGSSRPLHLEHVHPVLIFQHQVGHQTLALGAED
jgi:hypothetical protein